jgi:extracellular factor (EF) 3-hydroxypalmitic acid methyl ester biosynthesis protein
MKTASVMIDCANSSRGDSTDPRTAASTLVSDTYEKLSSGDVSHMDDFVVGLKVARQQLGASAWQQFLADVVDVHPLRRLIHEEPFTRRAYEKPRGYPGDAPLLDLIYRDEPYSDALSEIGARLHNWIGSQPACCSVNERRSLLAALIDQIAAERPMPRVLSLACGHLREAQLSTAVREGRIEEFVAVDQDAESIELVEREQSALRVTTVKGSIRRLLVKPCVYGTFDLAYSAGLYDYLDDAVATALTASMFAALRPGGLLLLANFTPQLRDIGYMEAMMDWKLIYRNESALDSCSMAIDPRAIAAKSLFRDSGGNVVYLTLRKRA